MSKSIAIVLYDGCTLTEVMDFVSLFGDDNAVTFIDGSKGASGMITTSEGLSLSLPNSPSALQESIHDCVIVAGGNVASIIENEEVGVFLRKHHENAQTIIGGICNGAWVLAKSGVLKGKTVTHTAHTSCNAPAELISMAARAFEESAYSFENVVVDGQIVTAKPWAKAEFTIRVAELAGVIEKDRADHYLKYLKGEYRAEAEG
jgi:putative intracellular protease/amidase